MSDVLALTLTELSQAIAQKRVSPVELMQAVLERIDRGNEKINAVVAMFERDALLAQAKVAEARGAKGAARPLEGIPLGVKDLEDAAGLVTTHGSVPFKDNLAKHDSTQVARLKAAGAIVVREPYSFEEFPNVWIATLADPDDNYFQLMTPFDPATMGS